MGFAAWKPAIQACIADSWEEAPAPTSVPLVPPSVACSASVVASVVPAPVGSSAPQAARVSAIAPNVAIVPSLRR